MGWRSRRAWKRLRRAEQLTLEEAHQRVEAVAVRTEEDVPGPSQADVELWKKHSLGSWKRGAGVE